MLENLGERITNFGEGVKAGATNAKDKIALTAKIEQAKREIRKVYDQLGERFYNDKKDQVPEEYADLFKAISDKEELIEQCEEQKKKIDGIRKCPNCGADVAKDHLFCTECGSKVEFVSNQQQDKPDKIICMGCGAALDLDSKFCNQCGMKLEGVVVEAANEGKNCPVCGNKLDEDAIFCNNCGTKI